MRDDDEPAAITRGELRRLLEMEEDHARIKWLLKFLRTLTKWCAMVAALVVALEQLYANFVRGVIK